MFNGPLLSSPGCYSRPDMSEEEQRTVMHFPLDTPVPMPGGHWERQGEELIAAFTSEEAVFALAWADFSTGRRTVENTGEEAESGEAECTP